MDGIKKVMKCSDVDIQNITFGNIMMTRSDDYVVAKEWYRESRVFPPHTLHIQTPFMKIHKVTETNDIIVLPEKEFEECMEKLDKTTIDYIERNNIVNKCGLVNPELFKFK